MTGELERSRARTLIEQIDGAIDLGAAEVDRRAEQAWSFAFEAGDRLLEAEARLAACPPLALPLNPPRVMAGLRHAERIFLANGFDEKAADCHIATAQLMYHNGEELRAIGVARQALQACPVPVESRSLAFTLMSLCLGRLGELDAALRCARDFSLPLALACRRGEVIAQALLAQALCLVRVLIYRQGARVHRGWPGRLPVMEEEPDPHMLLGLFAQAQAALPSGRRNPYLDATRLLAEAWMGTSDTAVDELERTADRHEAIDPPLAAVALQYQGLLLRQQGNEAAAHETLMRSVALAKALKATSIVRDSSFQLSRLYEAMGNAGRALQAYKQFSELRVAAVGGIDAPDGTTAVSAGLPQQDALPMHRLRSLEPTHVRRAVRYIEARPGRWLAVGDVVTHCAVGRRTLELAFRASKAITIAGYIRRNRVRHAARLLSLDARPVPAIAAAMGYRSSATFTAEFRAQFGVTPSQWRRLVRSGNTSPSRGVNRP